MGYYIATIGHHLLIFTTTTDEPTQAGEQLAGTLLTIHNVHFMNRLMKDIRQGIATDTLDEVEKYWVHPDLMDELRDKSEDE